MNQTQIEALDEVAQAASKLHQINIVINPEPTFLTGHIHGADIQIVAVDGGYEAWITDPDAADRRSRVEAGLTVDEAAVIIADAYMHDKAAQVLAREGWSTGKIEHFLEDDERAAWLFAELDGGSRRQRTKQGAPDRPIIMPMEHGKELDYDDPKFKQAAWEQAQIERLERLAQDTAGWGVLILMRPPGDVAFLAPIAPDLRGYEIVAADPNGKYDLWRNGSMEHADWTVTQVSDWLRQHTPSDEEELKAALPGWVEDVMRYYNVPKRGVH